MSGFGGLMCCPPFAEARPQSVRTWEWLVSFRLRSHPKKGPLRHGSRLMPSAIPLVSILQPQGMHLNKVTMTPSAIQLVSVFRQPSGVHLKRSISRSSGSPIETFGASPREDIAQRAQALPKKSLDVVATVAAWRSRHGIFWRAAFLLGCFKGKS